MVVPDRRIGCGGGDVLAPPTIETSSAGRRCAPVSKPDLPVQSWTSRGEAERRVAVGGQNVGVGDHAIGPAADSDKEVEHRGGSDR